MENAYRQVHVKRPKLFIFTDLAVAWCAVLEEL